MTPLNFRLNHLAWLLLLPLGLAMPAGPAAEAQNQPAQNQAKPDGQRGGQRPGMRGPTEVGWTWWKDPDAVKEMGLTTAQVTRLDSYYNSRQRQLKHFVDDYLTQLDALDKMTRERVVDEDTYSLQVARVEVLRSKLSESRTMMLYRMFKALEPAQYQKLRELLDRRFRGRGGGGAR